ncbi:MAG: class I SAM-dependent methyltransferase [Thermoleophilaceae bacterium]|nr:class I SAM-dependent methyltransferase [Thermoleophilaceae bacterium]
MSRSVDSAARRAMFKVLSRMQHGRVELVEPGRTHVFGRTRFENPVTAHVQVHDPHFYTAFFRGSLGLAESYIDGEWDSDDLTSFVRVGAMNMPAFDRARAFYRVAEAPARRAHSWLYDERRHRSKTARHYNLGNDLFARMLDQTMTYSTGIFSSPDDSLEDAQYEKFDRICRRLRLSPGDQLLEIGTGWGGFALHAASNYGVHVTTTTISDEQARLARERVREAGMEQRITIIESDFADLTGSYDKLATIEMIETIGWKRFDEFFAACDRLLKPEGLMCHQIITIDDRAYEAEKMSRSFINSLIFEGGSLPSNAYIASAIERHTSMQLIGFEDITAHYPETLRRWRASFNAHFEELRGNGYDERFARLWNLYLTYCEAGFIERRILVGQGLYAKSGWRDRLPATESSAPEHARRSLIEQPARAA